MPEFDSLRQQLRESRSQRDAASDALSAAREKLKRIAARETELDRSAHPDHPTRERERLRAERAEAEGVLKQQGAARERALGFEASLLEQFARLSDPREGIQRLKDGIPILLMPVRLETRFKGRELWVRIYPDDCWMDSFSPTLTESEVENGKAFWVATYAASGVEDQERAAWRALVASQGSGRATWIAQQLRPQNFADAPDAAALIFPELETKQSAWSQAPKLTILPDRFVFLGYDGSAAPKVVLGRSVPSPLIAGPDPTAPDAEQIQHDAEGNVVMPDELKWMSDFERAVEVGMGLRVDLNEAQTKAGFDRVLVIGLRLNADETQAKTELETLLQHHSYSRKGLALVPQGTPTNNTEAAGSGLSRLDDPDESFAVLKAAQFGLTSDPRSKKDGQWLAEYLGLDPELFAHTQHAGATDQSAARAMNTALWPATLGYWMETMMAPVFSRDAIEHTRAFFNGYVIAGGAIPALRIGRQPYGILPATAHARSSWFSPRHDLLLARPDPMFTYLQRLHALLQMMSHDWDTARADVSFVGNGSADPHATLLDIVGLHPGSVEWSQRNAESLKTFYNRLTLLGFGGFIGALITAEQRQSAHELLARFGFAGPQDPPILEKIFSGKHNLLTGGVVDDRPLSESVGIRAYTDAGENYLQWLIDAAHTTLNALYVQDGFTGDRPPAALLFLFLRHALQLGYHDVSIRLHESAGLFNTETAALARTDDPFLHIRENAAVSESRYQILESVVPQISGTQRVSDFITARIPALNFAHYLRDQLAALEHLKSESTARLERVFADHVDCCSYRLDAWRLGLTNYQLQSMRGLQSGGDAPARTGIYLGAYAWLEELRPENKELTPVRLTDPALLADFGGADEPPLMRDSKNEGYIHAPSLNHAVAAAVLRNGYISNASAQNRQTMAVNLTSERVRTALAMLEGIRAGQSLADLLGYQFERGLHDRHSLAEVDQFVLKLRKAFPLRADRFEDTKTEEGISIEAIEARNVVDGLALVEFLQKTGKKVAPDVISGANPAESEALNAEADRLLDAHDAVADLALSEGVYQAVLGNYDRVASTYDAYARGNFPPEPDVIRTPLNGIGLTHRVALHLEAGADPHVSPLAGLPMTPRAQAEPALNRWLANVFPPLDQVGCAVEFREAATGAMVKREVTLRQLNLQPADLLALIRDDHEQAMSELDDRILRHAVTQFGPRPDVPIRVLYLEKHAARFNVFELLPLIRNLRRLTTKSRPLRTTDLALINEAQSSDDTAQFVDPARLAAVRAAMQTLRTDLANFQSQLEPPLFDPAKIDNYIGDVSTLLARAATFAIAQAGWGLAYDFRRRTFAAILEQFAQRVVQWDDRLTQFAALLAEEAALPIAATDEDRFALLLRAEGLLAGAGAVSPVSPAALRTNLETATRPAFVGQRNQLDAVRETNRSALSLLLDDVRALLPLTDFDLVEFSLAAHEAEIVRFGEDAVALLTVIGAELDRRLSASQTLFHEHAAATEAVTKTRALEDAAKVLLGDDFRIFPEFKLSSDQQAELTNAVAASQSNELFDFLINPTDPAVTPLDFPVDTWLYGLARVREKMFAWEQTTIFAEALQSPELALTALQLPFTPNDRWLGLEFPPEQKLDRDRLLYTAHFATPFTPGSAQCGLLLDEWTEVIPTGEVDTGIAFHHDRPNCEAPQSMLLVTPTDFRGTWQWNDLVDALHETLDLAKSRAVEPAQIDRTAYAPFLPATILATQARQLTIAADLAVNNRLAAFRKN